MHPLAAIATLVSFAQHGNRIDLQLDHGSAEMVWLSSSTFRFRRSLEGALPDAVMPRGASDGVALTVADGAATIHIHTKDIDVALTKSGALLTVNGADGVVLAADLSEPHKEGDAVVWERAAPAGVRFYGLGPLDDPEFDLRGKNVDGLIPFVLSTAGYGEQHPFGSRLDFTPADRYVVRAPSVDYYFFYGKTPKAIFKERTFQTTQPPFSPLQRAVTWESLRSQLLESVHQAISTHVPRFFLLSDWDIAPDELKQRARQLGSLVPGAIAGVAGLSGFRQQLNSFYDIYAIEERDQGRPVWHALPFQFPEDPECAHHADEFMLGDEMLIAPIYTSGGKRQVYLPPGTWTSLETNREYPGRSTIPVETNALPVFARNGTIVPLDSSGGLGLHYFPKAGGEFFLIEKETGQYTQIHAAPALDIMRLEIESKKERDYQWVVHHVERPSEVGFDDVKYQAVQTLAALTDHAWFYDAPQKNLIIRVHVKAGEDNIVNLSW